MSAWNQEMDEAAACSDEPCAKATGRRGKEELGLEGDRL